jgi:hypothetical protein
MFGLKIIGGLVMIGLLALGLYLMIRFVRIDVGSNNHNDNNSDPTDPTE